MTPERSLLAVWTVALCATTLTVSVTAPTSSLMAPRGSVSVAVRLMFLRSTDLKPGELTVIEYSPGATLVKVKSPRSLVALRRIAPVVVRVSRMSALTTARSEVSRTEPTIVPLVVCAESAAASRKANGIGRGIGLLGTLFLYHDRCF